MDEVMARLAALMMRAERPMLLTLLATMIGEMTIFGRTKYDDGDAADQLRRVNESIHRLAGHLRDLCDSAEPFTASRSEGVCEQIGFLPVSQVARLRALIETG